MHIADAPIETLRDSTAMPEVIDLTEINLPTPHQIANAHACLDLNTDTLSSCNGYHIQ